MMFPKHQYVRSKAMMEAYRKIPCQHCGADDGTVCGAHTNWGYGRGRGIKADDNKCASLCFYCHGYLDHGKDMSKTQRQQLWDAAHIKTVNALVRSGEWPLNVPIPDTRMFDA